ncbi:MAG: transposase [Synergistaceae bacterium]|nr:transposase [Synergistaceae bacterium]
MKRISQTLNFDYELTATTDAFFRRFKLCSVLKKANVYKPRGIPAVSVFQKLFNLAFNNRSLFMELKTGTNSYKTGKDTFYRFINSCSVNWGRFTSLLAERIINSMITKRTDENRVNVFIVDDTLYERSRTQKVELLTKVFDHSKHRYTSGFRLLTLGWSDGNTFLPVNSSLLSSGKDGSRIQESRDTQDRRSCDFKIRKLAQTKAPAVMLEMIDTAVRSGISASHVLFDSWFCSPSTLMSVKKRDMDVIAMAKKTSKVHYMYKGQMLPVTEIYRRNRKRRGRSRYLLSAEIQICSRDGSC